MKPSDILSREHRVIEQVLDCLEKMATQGEDSGQLDGQSIEEALDFFRNFADRCHHGKEEDLLFRDLESKPLEAPLKGILHELIQEHVLGRQMVGKLAEAGERYHEGDPEVLGVIEQQIAALIDFYPRHIEKEDRHFFVPVMDCFTKKELANLLDRFHEFDRQLIHERYRQVVSTWEHRK